MRQQGRTRKEHSDYASLSTWTGDTPNTRGQNGPMKGIFGRMPGSQMAKSNEGPPIMNQRQGRDRRRSLGTILFPLVMMLSGTMPALAQRAAPRDPAEPAQRKPPVKVIARPAGGVARQAVDEKSMRALIGKLVACGTRLTLSSWTDPKRGIGCGRDAIVARFNEIAKDSGGKLQVVVDKFESTSGRTAGKPIPLENVYAILPGSDPKLAKTIFIVSGHFDSRPSDVMDPQADAPGADDDASGLAVSVECARLLSKAGANGRGRYRATILFAAVSGEEQGLLGSTHLLEWTKQQGYTVGGMLDDDIVGADPAGRAKTFGCGLPFAGSAGSSGTARCAKAGNVPDNIITRAKRIVLNKRQRSPPCR